MKGIQCAFEGRLGRDAQRKTTGAGRAFMVMSVIVGEDEDEQWLNVSAWSDHLVDLAGHLTSGVEVYVEGRLKMRHWEEGGQSRSGLQVSATKVEPLGLIGHRRPKQTRAAKGGKAKAGAQAPLAFADGADSRIGDALPF